MIIVQHIIGDNPCEHEVEKSHSPAFLGHVQYLHHIVLNLQKPEHVEVSEEETESHVGQQANQALKLCKRKSYTDKNANDLFYNEEDAA